MSGSGGAGRFVPWLAFVLGAAASVAANVAHAATRAESAGMGAMVAAAWAPVALLITVELVTRSPRPGSRMVAALRMGGTVVVAGVAAVASYRHMVGLLLSYGEDALIAYMLPLSVDGMMLVAGVALAAPVSRGLPEPGTEVAAAVPDRHGGGTDAAPVCHEPGERPVEVEPAPASGLSVSDAAFFAAVDPIGTGVAAGVPQRHGSGRRRAAAGAVAAEGARVETVTEVVADDREQARGVYRAALAAGSEISGKELGMRFSRSERWGRSRIRECREPVGTSLT